MEVAKHWRETPERYRLEAEKCKKCGAIQFPNRLICPVCQAREFEPVKLSGKGKIHTYTIIRMGPPGFTDIAPYAVAVVELDEGVKIMGQVADCNPEDLKTGDRVTSKFRRMQEDGKTGMIQYCYKFVPDVGI